MKRRTLVPAFLVMLTMSMGAAAALLSPIPETSKNDVAELAPGIFFRHGDLKGESHCNNGFVVFEDFVVVVDANFPSGAEACLKDIRERTSHPVRFVFDTHHHGDHAYGNPIWRRHGALPVAAEKVVEEFKRFEPQRWAEQEEKRADIRALKRDGPMLPVLTYPRRMVIDDGKRRMELLHFGTAHTRGDGFAYLPKEKVLYTGDTVVNGPYNYMGDGDTGSWLDVLDALLELDVEVVAPGHGPCGDRSLIELQRRYIATLRFAVRDGIAAGKSLEELQQSVKVPAALERYVGERFQAQIAKIYEELTAR